MFPPRIYTLALIYLFDLFISDSHPVDLDYTGKIFRRPRIISLFSEIFPSLLGYSILLLIYWIIQIIIPNSHQSQDWSNEASFLYLEMTLFTVIVCLPQRSLGNLFLSFVCPIYIASFRPVYLTIVINNQIMITHSLSRNNAS